MTVNELKLYGIIMRLRFWYGIMKLENRFVKRRKRSPYVQS